MDNLKKRRTNTDIKDPKTKAINPWADWINNVYLNPVKPSKETLAILEESLKRSMRKPFIITSQEETIEMHANDYTDMTFPEIIDQLRGAFPCGDFDWSVKETNGREIIVSPYKNGCIRISVGRTVFARTKFFTVGLAKSPEKHRLVIREESTDPVKSLQKLLLKAERVFAIMGA